MAPSNRRNKKKGAQSTKKKNNTGNESKAKKGMTRAARVGHQLDAGAKAWLKLLSDPCGADLAHPCYGGTTSGYLTRMRYTYTVPATAVDFIAEWNPSELTSSFVRYCWATSVGGSLGNASNIPGGVPAPFLTNSVVGRYRPVAGCLKVHYTGAELDRKGSVGLNLSFGETLVDGEGIGSSAPAMLAPMATVARLGSVAHEIRWLPGLSDGEFSSSASGDDKSWSQEGGGSIQVVITGMPAGTAMLEFISVYEWQPAEESSPGLRSTMEGPRSRNHLNEILSAVGDVGKWAVGGPVAGALPVIMRTMAQAAAVY